MLYLITNSEIKASYCDFQYEQIKNEPNVFWLNTFIPTTKTSGLTEEGEPITIPNTYFLTYAEKVDSLRFKRQWLLDKTDCGVVQDSPLDEERLVELKAWRTDLRNFTQFVTEGNIDTYLLPAPPAWAVGWFKL